ncbi:hypothetical protein Efla_003886 [Eimeria flavescens]
MEKHPSQGSAKGTRLRLLRRLGPLLTVNRNANPQPSEPPHSPRDARLFFPRRQTDQLFQRTPLKMLQSYVSKAVKRTPHSEIFPYRIEEASEECELVLSVPRKPHGEEPRAPQQVYLELQKPLQQAQSAGAASSAASEPSRRRSLLAEANSSADPSATCDQSVLVNTTEAWQQKLKHCSFIFTPAVPQPVLSFRHVQDAGKGEEAESAETFFREDSRSKRGNECALEKSLLLLGIANKEGGSISKNGAELEELEGTNKAATRSAIFSDYEELKGNIIEEDSEVMPLLLVTPRVVDNPVNVSSREAASQEKPHNDFANAAGIRGGLAATLNLLLSLLQKVVVVLEESNVLAACRNAEDTDECQIVVDASSRVTYVKEGACAEKTEANSEWEATHLVDSKNEGLTAKDAELRERLDDQEEEDRFVPLKTNMPLANNREYARLVQSAAEFFECPERPAMPEDGDLSGDFPQNLPDAPFRITCVGSCSVSDSQSEESAEPSIPVAAAADFTKRDRSPDSPLSPLSKHAESGATSPRMADRRERLPSSAVASSFKAPTSSLSPRAATDEAIDSVSGDSKTVAKDQTSDRGFLAKGCLLSNSPGDQKPEVEAEDVGTPALNPKKKSLWQFQDEENEAIPAMHLPATDRNSSDSSHSSLGCAQPVDALEDEFEEPECSDSLLAEASSPRRYTGLPEQPGRNCCPRPAPQWTAMSPPLYSIRECEEEEAEALTPEDAQAGDMQA